MKKERNIITMDGQGNIFLPSDIGATAMTEWEICELFGVIAPTVRAGIKALCKSGVLSIYDIKRIIRISDRYSAAVYNLETIAALAFRIESFGGGKSPQSVVGKDYKRAKRENDGIRVGCFGRQAKQPLERENTALHKEVADHEETIEALQDRIQTMRADHSRQMAEVERKHRREIADKETKHKEEISFLKTVIARAAAWFPYFREMLRIENLCRLIGFDERQTATLVKGKPLEYAGELYSEEHKRKFTTEKAGFQVLKDPTDGTRLVLAIDRKPIPEWFKEQFEKLRQNIRRPIQPQRKGRGI